MRPIITLTTDFGESDGYVATMKGVILAINPEVLLVDITHAVSPQGVREAAFILGNTYHYFPSGTVHLVVVDPGVGTARRPIILATPKGFFVAPDNGVLSYVLAEYVSLPNGDGEALLRGKGGSDLGLKAVVIENPCFWLCPVSTTFHGRDIFAPVAAYLARGTEMERFGPEVPSLTSFTPPRPTKCGGTLRGQVIHIDHFGNLITNLTRTDLPKADDKKLVVELSGYQIQGLSKTYASSGGLVALIGSNGYLEIALSGASAALFSGARIGDSVSVMTTN